MNVTCIWIVYDLLWQNSYVDMKSSLGIKVDFGIRLNLERKRKKGKDLKLITKLLKGLPKYSSLFANSSPPQVEANADVKVEIANEVWIRAKTSNRKEEEYYYIKCTLLVH